jgi:hypothetical protein
MHRVNQFMMQRGLETFKMKNVGGEEGFEIQDINEVSAFYAQYLKELENAISKVPMGKPTMAPLLLILEPEKTLFLVMAQKHIQELTLEEIWAIL